MIEKCYCQFWFSAYAMGLLILFLMTRNFVFSASFAALFAIVASIVVYGVDEDDGNDGEEEEE